jgi:hypothetical protein
VAAPYRKGQVLHSVFAAAKYLSDKCTLGQFVEVFFGRFKNESRVLPEDVYLVLDELFGNLDAFTENEDLLRDDPDYYLNAEQVGHCIRCACESLKK